MRNLIKECKENNDVKLAGWVYRVKEMKAFSFVVLQDRTGYIQLVIPNELMSEKIGVTSSISILGLVKKGRNDFGEIEVLVSELEVLNGVQGMLPIPINGNDLDVSLEHRLNHRVLGMHHQKEKAIFKVQALVSQGFTNFLVKEGFQQIFTPKIVNQGAEGGSEVFKIPYFESEAYLAQSPQFYKQMMVASTLERVFEIGHVYRAEKHSSNRHLNEYVSLDVEMGFIEDENDLMELEEALLKFIVNHVATLGIEYIELLGATLPTMTHKIPRMELSKAIEILKIEFGMNHLTNDIDAEGEKAICKYAQQQFGSEFIFLTNYPKKKRPMYTMPLGENGTRSFDLLFRGIEITTGGQRIHNHKMLVESMESKGLCKANYESYLEAFKYGMPPHGGFAIGLERLTAKLLGYENIRLATLFPRDRQRLQP